MDLRKSLEKFYEFLGQPIFMRARLVLLLLLVPLALSFTQPLWRIHMVAPQYPKGLDLYIWSYKVEGGHGGRDLQEINTLNHYIGMQPIERASLTDLDWIPFAFGLLILLGLRVAAVGSVRSLIDLVVLNSYVGLFALGRFVDRMHSFGHDLEPTAPFKVEPFMPVIVGHQQVANFSTSGSPCAGTWLIAVHVVGVVAVLVAHLIVGRRRAVADARGGARPAMRAEMA